MNSSIKSNKAFILWLYIGCFLVFAMVVVGGITRLTGSGLSITEWKVVTGTLPPLTETKWMEEFSKYQQTPQFQKINAHFTLADFKNIYWWEFIHRFIGRIIGLVFIGGFAWFYFKKQIDRRLIPQLIIMFLLGAWQGFLGWYMVKSGLVENTYVSHYRLAIHLINAFLTFGFIFWVAQNLVFQNNRLRNSSSKSVFRISFLILFVLVLQIIYGAFVAGLHAGQVYNTWPKMNDEWIATSVTFAFQKDGVISLFDNLASVQFIHRTLAIILSLLVFYLWMNRKSKMWQLNRHQISAINFVWFFVVTQFVLGVFTLLYYVPISMGVFHQCGAFALFGAVIHLLNRLRA